MLTSIPSAKSTVKVAFTNYNNGESINGNSSYENIHPTISNNNTSMNNIKSAVKPPPLKQLQDIESLRGDHVDFPSDGNLLYLIDIVWLNSWRNYCEGHGSEPGPINNWNLINQNEIFINQESAADSYDSYRFTLKDNIQDGIDLYLLNKSAWDALQCWYGGGPTLARFVRYSLSNNSWHKQYVHTDLYTSLMASDATIDVPDPSLFVDYWPEQPMSYNECLSALSIDSSSSEQIPTLIRVHSFEFNDCGASVTAGRVIPSEDSMDVDSNDYTDALEDVSIPNLIPNKLAADNAPIQQNDSHTFSTTNLKLDLAVVEATTETRESHISAMTSSSKGFITPGQVYVDSINTCFTCRAVAIQRCTKCHAVYYCSVPCQKTHWKFHKRWCGDAAKFRTLPREEFEKRVQIGKRGKIGLLNLGNSCYLSSCLQCLSHILPLTAYFLSSRYTNELNTTSVDGTGGKLATQYASLMQSLWFDNLTSLAPTELKNLLGKIREEYAGFQQHDAHEVVELLLDKLHEDLNRVIKKPYIERPEGDGTNDKAVADDSFKKHLLRENSTITDLMGSQMHSELVCPDCSKVTVCFEYQQTLQVAITRQVVPRIIKVIFIPNEIPKIFQNMKFGSSSAFGQASLAGSLTEVMQPVEFAFKVESNQCIGDIMTEFLSLLEKYSVETEDSVKHVLKRIQATEQADNSSPIDLYSEWFVKPLNLYSTDSIRLLETTSSPLFRSKECVKLQRYYNETESVLRVPEDTPVIAYNLDERPAVTAIIVQRLVVGNKPSVSVHSIGYPLVIVVEKSQNCAKFKLDIWKQISHVLLANRHYHKNLESIMSLITQSVFNVGLSLEFCRLLTVRVIKSSGLPVLTDYWRRLNVGTLSTTRPTTTNSKLDPKLVDLLSTKRMANGISVNDLDLGSSIPDDKLISIGDFLGMQGNESGEAFFSVDWEGLWAQLIDIKEPLATIKHDSCDSLTAESTKPSTLSPSRQCLEESGVITLEKCLREHTQEETLDQANAWYCSRCKKHQCAKKTVTFWKPTLPKVLIVVLKRFEFRNMRGYVGGLNQREKIETFVDFPIEGLDLSPFCHNSTTNAASGTIDASQSGGASFASTNGNTVVSSGCLYDLFAVCNHYGRMGYGHYTAFARDWNAETLSNTWYSFDDDIVEEVADPKSVVSHGAYILMYRRRP